MFRGATAFNSDISRWNTSSATAMDHMFDGAISVQPGPGGWNISHLVVDGDLGNATVRRPC